MKPFFTSLKITKLRALELAVETTYLLAVFLIPVWFAYFFPSFNMFELSKLSVFRFLVWFLLALTAIRLGFCRQKIGSSFLKITKLFLIPFLFLAGLAVSLFFSLDWQQSFFGSYDRQEGLMSQATYFLWSVLLVINLLWSSEKKTALENKSIVWRRVKRLVLTMVISTSLVALYGVLQIMGFDFLEWPEQPYLTGRALASLGQPNFLASFLLLGLPLTAYLMYSGKHFFVKSAYLILLIVQLACLFFTSSRGGLLAFLTMLALLAIYLLFSSSSLSRRVKISLVAAVIFLGFTSLAALELVTPGRVKESFDPTRGSFASRVFFFQASADAILERPIFGYGLENGSEVFIKYYERDWGIYGDVSSNTDRAHNIFLDILISAGFWGLCLLVMFYYYYFRLSWQELKSGHNKPLIIALFLGAFAYLTSLFFSFAIVAGEVYYWSLLAILLTMVTNRAADDEGRQAELKPEKVNTKWVSIIILALVVLLSLWQMALSLQVLMADYFKNKIFIAVENREFIEAVVFRSEISALDINPVLREHYDYYLGSQIVSYCLYGSFQDLGEEKILKDKLKIIINALPDSGYENILFKATAFACLADSDNTEKYFNLLEQLAPEWPRGYLERGHYLAKQGKLTEAEKYYQIADLNLPDPDGDKINSSHRRVVANYKFLMYASLAEGYFKQGNYGRAEMFFQAAFRYRPEDYSIFKKIADCYYLQGDLDTAIKYVRRGLAANPRDVSWHIALAVLYFENNNISDALGRLDEAEKIAPASSLSEIESLRLKFNQ